MNESDAQQPASNLQLLTSNRQSPTSNPQPPVILTGITGFVAGHLAERLLAGGVSVRGTARQNHPRRDTKIHEANPSEHLRAPSCPAWIERLSNPNLEIVQADLLDADTLRRAAAGCRAVVHAAAWTGGGELSDAEGMRVNVEGTQNVLAAAKGAGVERFIFISSVAVYGLNRAPLIDETAPTPPVGQAYPDSKIAAETLVRDSGLPYVIVRLSATYGPRGGAWTIGPVEAIKAGRLWLLGQDTGLVTPGYIDNVVDGLVLVLNHPAAVGETFNLCDDYAVTYREFYLAYARMLGRDRLPTLPGWFGLLARSAPANLVRRLLGRPRVGPWSLHFRCNPSQFSVAKAKRVLGYAPQVDFTEGMRRTKAWLEQEGYLRR